MNPTDSTGSPIRLRWEWVVSAGVGLAVAAVFSWVGSGNGSHFLYALLGCAALAGIGWWIEGRGDVARTYGQILIAGGIGGFFGSIYAAHAYGLPNFLGSAWVAWLLLAAVAAGLFFISDTRQARWLAGAGLVFAWMGVTFQQFTTFSLTANALLVVVAAGLFHRRQWIFPACLMLVAIYLGFLLGFPFSDGRIDADRYLELNEYGWTLAFFAAAWAIFTHIACRAPEDTLSLSRRLGFASLNNALFFGLGVLIVPPRHPAWFWMFSLAAGFLLLLAWLFAGRFPRLRRAYAVQGGTLVALGMVSAIIGREPAALLAVASVFFVLTCEDRRHGLLRFCAGITALLAFALAWDPVYRSETPSLWLGVFTGAPLVASSVWISRHREQWRRWAVLFFGALGLGLWMLTTLAQTPPQYHPPILAVEAVLVTASFYLLAIPEFPWLALSVLLLAQFLWFEQVDSFASRPWWNPFVVVVCTLGLSCWWQTRGRTLLPAWALRWVQGVAAIAAVAILVLSIESGFGVTPRGMVIFSILAVVLPYYAIVIGDRFLLVFGQLLMVTAIGEFIGQLTHSPGPGPIAALAPIIAQLLMAPGVSSFFHGTLWQRPANWLALLYRMLAAVMFVVWSFHYVAPDNRFLLLAFVAVGLLLGSAEGRLGALLYASSICVIAGVLSFWTGRLGAGGFHVRDLLGFALLLAFGRLLRSKELVPEELQRIGILIGLATLTQWVWLWVHVYAPSVPLTVVWAVVAALIVCLGWRLKEAFYLAFGWGLMVVALGRVLWVDLVESRMPMGSDPDFRWGLLAVGLGTLIAALTYARRPSAPASASA